VDATDPGEHNGDIVADPEAGVDSRTIPLDDSTSQANVSIRLVRYIKKRQVKRISKRCRKKKIICKHSVCRNRGHL